MKRIVLMVIGLGMAMVVFAQTGNVPKFGLDSVSCVENLNECSTLYKEWENAKLAPESFNPRLLITWREVFLNCPKSSELTYIRGERIMGHLIRQNGSNNPTVALAYYDTLGMLFDKRAEFFPINRRTGESQVEHIMEKKEIILQVYKSVIKNQGVAQNSGGKDVSSTAIKNNDEPIGPNNKYKNYQSLPDVGPIAGEFYVGHCNATPKPKDPPITEREMSVIWEFDIDNGKIGFSSPQPQGGGDRMVHYNRLTFYLADGQQITENRSKSSTYHRYNSDGTMIARPTYGSYYWIYLPDYNYDQIVVSRINAPEQTGKPDWNGYWNNYQDHIHQINYTLPINVKEAKAYYYFNQAKKASLKDAINYARNCTKDNYRSMVENEIVNNKTTNLSDIVYCNENYPKLSDRLEGKMFGYINSMSDCNAYLKCYSTSKRGTVLDDKVYRYVNTSNDVNDCDTYLKSFPNGNHKADVTAQKNEIASYNAAKRGGKAECTAYLTKYPNGRFVSEIQTKKDGIVKEENRLAQIKVNSNKGIWKLGNKLCNCTSDGIIMATLDQWNEDHSSFKGIIAASPGGLFQGDLLQKGNQLWFETKGWHKCLDDEVEFALNHDKSLEAEQLMKAKKMKFAKGTVVAHTYYSRGWLFSSSYRVTAKVDDWNDDYTRMKIQIVKTGGLDYIDGESIYEGKYIWVSPIGWE